MSIRIPIIEGVCQDPNYRGYLS